MFSLEYYIPSKPYDIFIISHIWNNFFTELLINELSPLIYLAIID